MTEAEARRVGFESAGRWYSYATRLQQILGKALSSLPPDLRNLYMEMMREAQAELNAAHAASPEASAAQEAGRGGGE